MLPTKFRFIWPSSFRGEDFQKSANQKQELPVASMFVNGSRRNDQSLWRTFHRCFLPSFGSFGYVISEEEIFRNRPTRNNKCLWWPCLQMDQDKMSNLYRGSSIDATYQVSVHLAEGFQRRTFWKSTNQKKELPVVGMFVNGSGQIEQSVQRTLHRCFLPSFHFFGQVVSAKGENLKNRHIRDKNCLWRPFLLMDWDKMSNLYRGPYIDASNQVSVHLAEGFQRRRLTCEKITDDR